MNIKSLSTISRDIDMAAILAYAEITGDFNPIHVDPAFAATTAMGGVIAHGTLSARWRPGHGGWRVAP